MYAPKLRDMTKEERWQEGFAYRIDSKCDALQEEISDLFRKAKMELGPQPVFLQSGNDVRNMTLQDIYNSLPQDVMLGIRQQQQSMLQNVYPQGAYNMGVEHNWLLGALGGSVFRY
jgi:hypothetical protein